MKVTLIGGPEVLDGSDCEIDPKTIKNRTFDVEYGDVPDMHKPGIRELGSQILLARYQLDERDRTLARFIES